MPEPRRPTLSSAIGPLVLIAAVVACGAGAFAYTAGWFSPERLTPDRLVDAFTPPGGAPPLGHRRNHAKGVCFIRRVRGANGFSGPNCRAPRSSLRANILSSDASTWPPPIRTRRMRRCACAASAS